VGTSAPRTGADRIFGDGAEPAEKKGAEWRVRNHQNNFCTSAPTENYFDSNDNNVSF